MIKTPYTHLTFEELGEIKTDTESSLIKAKGNVSNIEETLRLVKAEIRRREAQEDRVLQEAMRLLWDAMVVLRQETTSGTALSEKNGVDACHTMAEEIKLFLSEE